MSEAVSPTALSKQSWAGQGGVVHRAMSPGAPPTLALYPEDALLDSRTSCKLLQFLALPHRNALKANTVSLFLKGAGQVLTGFT